MPNDWSHIGIGDEVILLPLGHHTVATARDDLWDSLLARSGVDLFGQRCLVATVTGIRAQAGMPLLFDIETMNGDGSWPADRVILVEDLAPIGLGVEALERWLDN